MSDQQTPKKEKFILDATAGFRMMWFNKHHPNCIYLDQRPECEPDIVADFRDLRQFPDERFRLIVFDPPHEFRRNLESGSNSEIILRYGWLNPETWQQELKEGFAELWRILKPYGILLFKWSNRSIPANELLRLAPCEPLFYQVTKTEPLGRSKNRHLKTLWFCFMKIPEEE